MNILLILVFIWLGAGLLSLGLGYILLPCDDPECKNNRLWKNLFIILLGFIALLGIFDDIGNEYSNY